MSISLTTSTGQADADGQKLCPCIKGDTIDCEFIDGFQIIKGVRVPFYVLYRQHKLNDLQIWAITTRENGEEVPAALTPLIPETNGFPGLLGGSNATQELEAAQTSKQSTPAMPGVNTWANSDDLELHAPGCFQRWEQRSPVTGLSVQNALLDRAVMEHLADGPPVAPATIAPANTPVLCWPKTDPTASSGRTDNMNGPEI